MVVDAQGGGLGKAIIERLKKSRPNLKVVAVGTNAIATGNMLKAGADEGATGENAVVVNSRKAMAILGGIGIIAANSMLGEITPKMAEAISSADGPKFLIPLNKCDLKVVGARDMTVGEMIDGLVGMVSGVVG